MIQRIKVRRSVYAAAQKLAKEAESEAGITAIERAEKKIDECQAAGDTLFKRHLRARAGARFWTEVRLYLMATDFYGDEAEIVEDQ